MLIEDSRAKIDVVFCDDTKMPHKVNIPPMNKIEEQRQENFFKQLDKEFGFVL